jgi:hypothetical protein
MDRSLASLQCPPAEKITVNTNQAISELMLSKCANQNCTNTFRYLHEGRLYVVDSRTALNGNRPRSKSSGRFKPLIFAWLCSSCCSSMTIQFDAEFGTMAVPMGSPGQTTAAASQIGKSLT